MKLIDISSRRSRKQYGKFSLSSIKYAKTTTNGETVDIDSSSLNGIVKAK